MFHNFADTINNKFNQMTEKDMYITDIDRSVVANNYIDAFPEGSNPIYKERTEHDCQICRQFIKYIGNAVTINDDGTLDTVWDVDGLEYPYNVVATTLAEQVRSAPIKSVFLHNEKKVGKQHSLQLLEDNTTRKWDHFYADIPDKFYTRDLATLKSKAESRTSVHARSLAEISIESVDTLLDLLNSDSIYRGEEHKAKVIGFRALKIDYDKAVNKNAFAWLTINRPGAGIRNSVIGTLLVDIEEGVPIEQAVAMFEAKVAPTNYKRTKSVVTKRMLEAAIKVIDDNDIRTALPRRQAISSDVSVNDVIFADRSVNMKDRDPLMDMLEPQPVEVKGLDTAPEISIDDFITNVVPTCSNISIVSSNAINANKVQVSAPEDSTAKNILQWDNNFSWAYKGNVTTSEIAQNVKNAGGAIDGYLRCSLQWNEEKLDSSNDLDLHCRSENGHISYQNKQVKGGTLDIDITNPHSQCPNAPAVENITWPTQNSIPDGNYQFFVKNYSGTNKKGFRIEIAIGADVYNYDYPTSIRDSSNVNVAIVTVKNGNITIKHQLPHTKSNSGELVPVKMMMLSPNYWGNNTSGTKHYFFLTDEEQDTTPFRGHFPEYLNTKYHDIRKSLDMLASKMQCQPTTDGLHGYGFTYDQKTPIFIKADSRLYKINFTKH